jgi:hypothetical protein
MQSRFTEIKKHKQQSTACKPIFKPVATFDPTKTKQKFH